ncbi:hypothetical protein P3H80_07920 [Mycolicibacterium septicum]|uniref:hypothetical protein n=1 Tax=Mycolicibacterium septicum TaxID=98668 RepID=UPI0023E0CBFB|nr:hypothetical protein [Mycolicibacterium septicum]MDF3337342.1 hypothetical protein [Mycolicibacterium septicum]
MHLTLRPYVTTGISIVGAAAIAVSPINPATSDIHAPAMSTSSAAVELTGVTNPISDPITALIEVLTSTAQNVATLGGQVADNGAPALTQVVANLTGYAQAYGTAIQNTGIGLASWQTNNQWLLDYAYEQFQAGQVGEAISYVVYALSGIATAMFPMLDTLKIPGAMAQNFADVVQAIPRAVTSIGLSTIVTAQAPFHAFGRQVQGLVDAVNAGDPLAAANAVLNIPAAMTGALLDAVLQPFTNEVFTGVIGALVVGVPNIIAEALKPTPPAVPPTALESARGTLVAALSDTNALPAEETPAIEARVITPDASPATTDQTPVSARLAKEVTSGLTATVDDIANAAASAFNAVKTVTLKVDPGPAATETSTTGGSSALTDADSNTGNSSGAGAGTDASRAPKVKADKESKRPGPQHVRAYHEQAHQVAKKEAKPDKHVSKAEKSGGGKHRAAKSSDK